MDQQIMLSIAHDLALPFNENEGPLTRDMLAEAINEMIQHDFERLVQLLYRVDVDEARLRRVLKENKGTAAGYIIADLLAERQAQKLKSRQAYKNNRRDNTIDDEERW